MTNLHTSSGGLIIGSCKQTHLGSQTYVGLLVATNIIFCATNHTRWTTTYTWASTIESILKTHLNKKVLAADVHKVPYPLIPPLSESVWF